MAYNEMVAIYGSMAHAAIYDPTGVALIAVIGFGIAWMIYEIRKRSE